MPILGNGIGFPMTSDRVLKTFLCDQLGIHPEYLEHRIQTILVNGRAIDEVEQVHMAHGDVIALSAAMPGLVGATLRRGSHLAEMRSTITHASVATQTEAESEGVVTLKLFNLVAKEIGPMILEGPILLKQKDLEHLCSRYPNIVAPRRANISEDWLQIQVVTTTIG